jgi:hypothetical protein
MSTPTAPAPRRFTVVHSMDDLPAYVINPTTLSRIMARYILPNWQTCTPTHFRATAWAYLMREDGGAVVILNGQRYTHGNPPTIPALDGGEFDRKHAGPHGQVAKLIERVGAMLRLSLKWAARGNETTASNLEATAGAELIPLVELSQKEKGGRFTFTANGERFDELAAAVLEACGLEADALEGGDMTKAGREQAERERRRAAWWNEVTRTPAV